MSRKKSETWGTPFSIISKRVDGDRLAIIDNPCYECYLSAMSINVNLTPELEGLIRQKVSSGRYNSASEVVREALRLMEAEDQMRAAKLARLRHEIHAGMHKGP